MLKTLPSFSTWFPNRLVIRILDFIVPLCLISLEIFLNVIAFGSVVNGVVLLLIVTSPLWVLLFLFWWPMILLVTCLLKFTSIYSYTCSLLWHSLYHMLYNYKGQPRKNAWSILYTMLALNLPNYITA